MHLEVSWKWFFRFLLGTAVCYFCSLFIGQSKPHNKASEWSREVCFSHRNCNTIYHAHRDSFLIGIQQISTMIVYSHSFKLHVTFLYPKRSNIEVTYVNDESEWWAGLPESTGWCVAALQHKGEDVLLKVFPSQMGKTQSRLLAKLRRWAEKGQGGGLAWLDLAMRKQYVKKWKVKTGWKASSGLNFQHAFKFFGPTWVLL